MRYGSRLLADVLAVLLVVGNASSSDQLGSGDASTAGSVRTNVRGGRRVAAAAVMRRTFPQMSVTLKEPDRIFQELTSRVTDFGSSLAGFHNGKLQSMARQEAQYEQELVTQERLNDKLVGANARIQRDIATLMHRNSLLRRRATEVQSDIDLVSQEMQILKLNMSTADEFANTVLKNSDVEKAKELKVLRELDEGTQSRSDKRKKMARLDQIMQSDSRLHTYVRSGLLQSRPAVLVASKRGVPSKGGPGGAASKEYLEHMASQLESLAQEHEEKSKSMRNAFEADFQNGTNSFAALMEDHQQLNSTWEEQRKLEFNLNTAVRHLVQTRTYLAARLRSMRLFMSSLGTEAVADIAHIAESPLVDQLSLDRGPLSLLQLNQTYREDSNLRRFVHNDMLEVPTAMYKELSSEVNTLDQQLRGLEQERVGSIVDQQLQYESKLLGQNRENLRLANDNSFIASEADRILSVVSALRTDAKASEARVEQLRLDLTHLHVNLTSAVDFADASLKTSYVDTADRELLRGLVNEDIKKDRQDEAIARINEIQHPSWIASEEAAKEADAEAAASLNDASQDAEESPHSLLATKVEIRPARKDAVEAVLPDEDGEEHPSNVLQDLRSQLDRLNEAHDTSDVTLKSKFSKALNDGTHLRAVLLREQATANRTLSQAAFLRQRVGVAITYLSQTEDYLRKQTHSLKMFLTRIGKAGIEVPIQAADAHAASSLKADKEGQASLLRLRTASFRPGAGGGNVRGRRR